MEPTRDLKQLESATSEAQYDGNFQPFLPNPNEINTSIPMPKGSTKRKQQLNSTKTKGKNRKKQRRSSASRQQPAEEEKTEEEKTVAQEIKVLKDRIGRRLKNDKMEDLEQHFTSVTNMQCPMRSDVQDIMKRLNEIGSEAKKTAGLNLNPDIAIVVEADLKQKLVQVREAIEKLNEQRKLDLIKAKNLEAIFNNSKVSEEIQREQFFAGYLEQTVTNGPTTTVGQDQGSLLTREQLKLQSDFSYLESEVYVMNNNKVDVSDFQGLKEALEKTTWGKTPDHLELIAIRIEEARGKTTEVEHNIIQVLVCAAIHEMEDLPLENFNLGTLKKWGATLCKAKELGFQVEFAEKLLRKNLYAYFSLLQT